MTAAAAPRALLVGPILARRDVPATRAFIRGLRLTARDRVIAVDGGYAVCRELGLAPALAVGDWDSLRGGERALPPGIERRTLSREKNRSDFFHALGAADGRDIVGIGFLGGPRADHHLANLLELSSFVGKRRVAACLWAPVGAWHFIASRKAWSALVAPGQGVSVFALGGRARGVRITGLRYGLTRQSLAPSSRGLSNEGVGNRCRVTARAGTLAIMVQAPADRSANIDG